jgi:integrase
MTTPTEKQDENQRCKRKRGRGEGSIFRRKDGRYAATISDGYRNGKRARKTFYGTTRKVVSGQLNKALRDQELGRPVAVARQTVGKFLDDWLEGTAKARLRPRTYADYKKIVKKHLVPALGHLTLQKLGPEHVQQLFAAKSAEGLSPRRVALIRAVLHTALNEAVKWSAVGRNVADLVKAPRRVRYLPMTLNQKQARALLNAAGKHRIGAVFSVATAVGLRLGESLGLRWQDVNLKKGTISVHQTLQRVDGKLEFVEPKSERSRRTVTLPALTVATLKRHATRQKKERLRAGGDWVDSGLVFTSTIGTPLDERNVRRDFKSLLTAAKLPKIRIHDLRHTCATLLLVQGVHPKVVQEILGHSQISLTLDTYSHVLPHVSAEAALQMDAALRA